jgi:hypothetical protein
MRLVIVTAEWVLTDESLVQRVIRGYCTNSFPAPQLIDTMNVTMEDADVEKRLEGTS